MDDRQWRRADEIFVQALDMPAAERDAFVRHTAGEDADLLSLVQRLLRHASDSGGELLPGMGADAARGLDWGLDRGGRDSDTMTGSESQAAIWQPGSVIDRYRLLEEVGRGGMAVVYRAERVDGDFEQQVAIKQLFGPLSQEQVRRFEQERQILARASHPDMARLLDGGIDHDPRASGQPSNGRPYLVMELVDGVPVDQYCDRERLTIVQRLDLFQRIARVVQYAHRNLVVHRDIKPSNILVTADGHPKLLDFGIARLLDDGTGGGGANGGGEALTRGAQPLTPAYASPEQLQGEPVTTLSDVYQLGLLLYLLLTGRSPYDQGGSASPQAASPLEWARRISEKPPTRPHRAVQDDDTARQRRTTLSRLTRQLRGDLGAIVLKTLRKEPERRYGSVEQLLDDLQRYRAGRTVAARPDSLGYRARTFVRRHRVAVGLAAGLLLALVTFSAVTAVQSRRLAAQSAHLAAERDRANHEAAVALEVSDFLSGLFRISDPSEARGNSITAREILDRGSADIDQRLSEPSAIKARLQRTMARVYSNLGLYEAALPLYQAALDTAAALDTMAAPSALAEVARARAGLARLQMLRGHYDDAGALLHQALDEHRQQLGDDHVETLGVTGNLASLLFFQGRAEEAEPLLRQALEIRRRVQGAEHPDTLAASVNLASVLFSRGQLEEAEDLYRQVYETSCQQQGSDHPRSLNAASNLGSVWIQLGRLDEAEPLLRATLESRRRVLGDDHSATLTTLSNLAGLQQDRGDLRAAEDLYREVLDRRLQIFDADHPRVLDDRANIADIVALDPARGTEAAELLRQLLTDTERIRGADHPVVHDLRRQLAAVEAGAND